MEKYKYNFCVIATEYQLLQVQALICSEFSNCENYLFNIAVREIDERLIDKNIWSGITKLPILANNSTMVKLTKKYLKIVDREYKSILTRFEAVNKNVRFIGASDDNTEYGIFKKIINIGEYVSIEDGLANYYHRNCKDILKIYIKQLLFNYLYNFKIEIYKNFGQAKCNSSYRMLPTLSVNPGKHNDLSKIMSNYFIPYWSKINKHYRTEDYLINKEIVNIIIVPDNIKLSEYSDYISKYEKAFYIPHPSVRKIILKDDRPNNVYTGSLTIEMLLFLNDHIKNIYIFSASSTIANILALFPYIKVYYNGTIESRYKKLFEKLSVLYYDRFIFNEPNTLIGKMGKTNLLKKES